MEASNPLDIADHIITHGVRQGILHLYTEDEMFDNNYLLINGKTVVNFGSCSYLGLEFDDRIRRGAIEAVQRYGTQFSESRAYVSLSLYREAETLLEQLFGSPCLITPTTTLGHIANLPVLIGEGDAVIMDQQVHSSVQTAAKLVKSGSIPVELVRHNRIDLLEIRIRELQPKYKRIWYLADGIYSMYGDGCPVDEIYRLLDRYPALHFYVDDAHGMSIRGANGKGYVLNGRSIHSRMVVAVSLAKSFATGGAVMVYPDREMARKVRTCGGPMITSGPMQPAALGALIAAARIHLSEEIYTLQEELHERIALTKQVIRRYGLPLVSASDAGIFFIGTSLPNIGYSVVRQLMEAGFYVNLGIFPAVPIKNTGIRFTITRLHTPEQIEKMVSCLATIFFSAIGEAGFSLTKVCRAFRIPEPIANRTDTRLPGLSQVGNTEENLCLYHVTSVRHLGEGEWDTLFQDRGTFDTSGLHALEAAYTGNQDACNNWLFDYLIIRDRADKIVLATFLTTAIWKDDMLSSDIASLIIERERERNPYYLTSRVISTGSLLSEGEHLFLDRSHPLWKAALRLFFDTMSRLQEERKTTSLIIRDFHDVTDEIDNQLTGNGFVRIRMPDTFMRSELTWRDEDQFYRSLSRRSRQHFREDIRKYATCYQRKVFDQPVPETVGEHWYQMYLAVKNRNYSLNTWPLPTKLFNTFLEKGNWEVIQLSLRPEFEEPDPVVSFVLCYKTPKAYIPMVIGIDYRYNDKYRVYRQALFQILRRARELGKEKVLYGFGAGTEKRKMGATGYRVDAYIQSSDHFNSQVIGNLATGARESILYEVKSTEFLS